MNYIRNFAIFVSLSFLSACNLITTTSKSDPVVGQINNENIYLSELKREYYKNKIDDDNTSSEELIDDIKEFLILYLNYRAKLLLAKDAGYFENEEILNELNQYEQQTSYPYWLENRVRDQLFEEYLGRAKYITTASHMLISLNENARPADSLRAWNQLLEARNKALNGMDFDSLSNIYSSSQRGQSIGGYLGTFPVGWSVKEFEDAVYTTPVGQISMPFRTQFGYHIIYVKDRRDSEPERYISHIFFSTPPDDESVDETINKANIIHTRLLSGDDYDMLAAEFSEDGYSAPMGGRIGWINWGRYNTQFTETVMSMTDVGGFSEPFYSGYGVHILRLDSIRTYNSNQEYRSAMMNNLQSLPRFRNNKVITIENVRKSGKEKIDLDVLTKFENLIFESTGAPYEYLTIPAELLNSEVYFINNSSYKLVDYLNWLKTNTNNSTSANYSGLLREPFFNSIADDHIVSITKNEFPAFASLSNEYLNGLVIFKINEDSVWNYSRADTMALQMLYNQDPDRFKFDTRYFYYRLSATSDSVITEAIRLVNEGINLDSLRNNLPGILVRSDVINDLSEFPYNQLVNLEPNDFTEIFDFRNRKTVFYLTSIGESRTMTFDEAFFRLVSEYQPIREQIWHDRLHSQYNTVKYSDRIK